MKRTMIGMLAAGAAVLAAAYLAGGDGTTAAAPQTGTSGTHAQQTMTPVQQIMQAPALETEECTEGYILLMPCPVCHTCPVCQANCGTAHALKCCLGHKKPDYSTPNGTTSGGQAANNASGMPRKQHVMTNKAEAVKHAAGHPASMPQTDEAVLSVISIESD